MSDFEIFEKAHGPCHNMDLQSKNIVYQIISRTKAAALSSTQKIFHLTQREKDALKHIENDFFANICEITP